MLQFRFKRRGYKLGKGGKWKKVDLEPRENVVLKTAAKRHRWEKSRTASVGYKTGTTYFQRAE